MVDQKTPEVEGAAPSLSDAPTAAVEERIGHLERALAEKAERLGQAEVATQELRASMEERERAMRTLREQLTLATGRYRAALLKAAPEIPPDLVQGSTVEELEASVERARQVVEHVRSQVESQAAGQRMPPGAPARTGPDVSVLSPQEKIAYAISRGQR